MEKKLTDLVLRLTTYDRDSVLQSYDEKVHIIEDEDERRDFTLNFQELVAGMGSIEGAINKIINMINIAVANEEYEIEEV